MLEILLLVPPLIFAAIPFFLRNWKALLIWHIVFSVLMGSFIALGDDPESPVGSAGAAMYGFFLIILHLISSGVKGTDIYIKNERGVGQYPVYALIAVLSYLAISVVTLVIGDALFA